MFGRTTWHNTITTPIPSDVKPANIIKGLHNHDLMISLSPYIVRHTLTSTSQTGKQTYEIVDNIDFLPFGLWKHQVSFTASFEDNATGTSSSIQALAGLVIDGDYAVKPAAGHLEAADDAMVLVEEVQTSVNVLFKLFVQGTLVSSHEKNHQKLIDWAREQGSGGAVVS
jgi:hypothetical protein